MKPKEQPPTEFEECVARALAADDLTPSTFATYWPEHRSDYVRRARVAIGAMRAYWSQTSHE